MKSMKKLITASMLGIAVLSSSAVALASEDLWGAAAAAADSDLTLEDMLTYSLQDEYLAHTEYEMIITEYGSVRPFSNIVKAEARHISWLLPLFEKYEFTALQDEAASRITLPDSLDASYAAGVEAEILNIDMYQDFLKEDLPEDVEAVFAKLLAGSEKHLVAFERAVDRVDGTVTPKNNGGSQQRSSGKKAGGQMRAKANGTGNQAPGAMGNGSRQAQGRAMGKPARSGLRDGSCQ